MKTIQLVQTSADTYTAGKVKIKLTSSASPWETIEITTPKGSYDLIEVTDGVYSGICHITKVTVDLNRNLLIY